MGKTYDFWGIQLWDSTGITYYTEVNVSQDLTHNVPVSVTEGYNAKYPFVVHNGIAFYYSGSCSGNFSDNTGECLSDYNFGDERIDEKGNHVYNVKYMDGFVKWLDNKRIKYMMLSKHFIIPIKISSPIKWSTDTTIDDGYNCKISFDWVQAGENFSLDDKPLMLSCPACGHIVAPAAKYCLMCGKRLYEESGYIYTGIFDIFGSEIKLKGQLFENVDDLNSRLSAYDVDVTNADYEANGFANSIVVFNQNTGICDVVSVGRIKSNSSYQKRIWHDNVRTRKTVDKNKTVYGTNFTEDTSVQWAKFTIPTSATATSISFYFAHNSIYQTNVNSVTLGGFGKDSKFILLSDRWHPYEI